MRRTILFLLISCSFLHARAKVQNWCEDGNYSVTVPGGAGPSSNKFQRSFPSCTVTVYLTGTLTLASLYSNNSGTVKANPFTAATSGQWFFYVDSGRYDIKFSGGGIPVPFTLSDYSAIDASDVVDCSTVVWCQNSPSISSGSVEAVGLLILKINGGTTGISLTQNPHFPGNGGSVTILASNGGGLFGTTNINSHFIKMTDFDGMGNTIVTVTGSLTVSGDTTFNSALTVAGVNTVNSLVNNGTSILTGASTFGSYLDLTNIAQPAFPSAGKTRLFAGVNGSGTCGGNAFIASRLYYQDSGGNCFGPLVTSGPSSSAWNISTTVAGTNNLTGLTYIGGNASADKPWAAVQNGVEVFRVGSDGHNIAFLGLGMNDTAGGTLNDYAARKLEVRDTTNQIITQFTGKAAGGSGAQITFYETTQLDGSLSWASGLQLATANAAYPINFYTASNLVLGLKTQAGLFRAQVNQYLDILGVADPPAACLAGTGGFTYNTTTNKLQFCNNGGAWADVGTGGAGTGWLAGSAANSGLNTDGSNRFIGLLTNHDMGFATNSIEAMRITSGQGVGIGTATPGLKLEVKDTSAAHQLMITGNTNGTTGTGIQFQDSAIRGQITMTTTSLAFSTTTQPMTFFPGTVSTLTLLGGATGRSALGVPGTEFTTGGDHTVTIASSDTDFGKLALFSTGIHSRMTLAVTVAATPVSGGELHFDSNDFSVNTAGHLTAKLLLQTGAGRTTGLQVNGTVVTIPGTLFVTGATTLTGGVSGNTTFSNNLTVTGTLAINGTLSTAGSPVVNNITVLDTVTWTGVFIVNANSCSSTTVSGLTIGGSSAAYMVTPDASAHVTGIVWSGRSTVFGSVIVETCNVTTSNLFMPGGNISIAQIN